MLPQLFEMDDYYSCAENNDIYCKVQGKLTFYNESLKEYVQNLTKDFNRFDRSLIVRSLCIPTSIDDDENYLKNKAEEIINLRINHYRAEADVTNIRCTKDQIEITAYDYIVLSLIISYTCFILFSTYYERKYKKHKDKTGIQKFLSEFSIVYNWKKKTDLSKNEDFKKLLSVQGFRSYTMILIILFHTYAVYAFIQLDNPTDFEEMMALPPVLYFLIINMHLVLNFFLLSPWMLTIQVNDIVKTHGEFSLKHFGIIILNRYFRLMTTAGVVLLFYISAWAVKIFSGPLNFDAVHRTRDMCHKNIIFDLLLIQNYLGITDSCNPISWYIAADFQIYILNAVVLYIWYKFKFNAKTFFAIIWIFSSIIYGSILYIKKLNGLYHLNLRTALVVAADTSPESTSLMKTTYTSAYSIFPASLVGTVFGLLYLRYKDKTIKTNKAMLVAWTFCVFILPHLVFSLYLPTFDQITNAIIGAIAKSLYCFAMAVGIFGMSHNFGKNLKKYFENKYIVVLGNFTYASYICHWLFMLGRHKYVPPFITVATMASDGVALLMKACFVGVIIALTIEEPGLSMQKRFLPQISKSRENQEKIKYS